MKHRFMKFRHDIIKGLPLVLMGFFLAWCGYYLVFGTGSVFSLRTMKIQEQQLTAHLDEVRAKREDVEAKVMRMRPDTLDWDMVEEQAILSLGEVRKDTKALNM